MGKRFIDSQIWGDVWFMGLKPLHKLIYIYVFSNCDASGLYKANLKKMQFELGEKIDEEKVKGILSEKISFSELKWLIRNFIKIQYPNILKKPDSPLHKSVLTLIEKNCLNLDGNSLCVDYAYSMRSLQVKEKEKEKNKDMLKDINSFSSQDNTNSQSSTTSLSPPAPPEKKQKHLDFVFLTPEQYRKMIVQYGPAFTKRCIEVLDAYIANNDRGKKYKDHSKVFRQWVVNRVLEEGLKPCPCDPEKIFREAEVQDRMSQIEQETFRDAQAYLSPPKGENLSQTDLSGFFKGIGRTI